MNYILFFLLLLPVKWIRKIIRKKSGKNLLVQTAKIGDFINVTPLLSYLQKSDVLISRTVAPLACHDNTINDIWYIDDYKTGFLNKIKLALRLMNRYDNIYLLHPNNANLFYAACCNASSKNYLSTYKRKWYQSVFYATADHVVYHHKNTLTLENYLRLADPSLTKASYQKHATRPLYKLKTMPESLKRTDRIKIGISISAGNQAKTIPPVIWQKLFDWLSSLPCLFYVFGSANESPHWQKLCKITGKRKNIINLIGTIPLKGLPDAIGMMDFYIASDTGNIYIADAMNVPVILIYGPCCIDEQRPLGDTLLIGPDNIAPSSFVFSTLYQFKQPVEKLFELNEKKLNKIQEFIEKRMPERLRN